MLQDLREKKKQAQPTINGWREIIKAKVEIDKIVTQRTMKESMKERIEHLSMTDKPLSKLIKKKKENTLIILELKKVGITTDTNEICKIIRQCFENLYYNKLENPQMDNFLDPYDLQNLNQKVYKQPKQIYKKQ